MSFGTMFNDIYIEHQDESNNEFSTIKVPLAYGPIQKFLARIEQKPDSRKRVAITLPRMSFEVGQLSYDSSRKSSTLQTFKALAGSNNTPTNVYMPVPYNLPLELSIATKYNDDMFQIVEQIIPYFRPEYNLTVDLVSSIGEMKDIPIILQSVGPFQDNYEGNYDSRRFITCTLQFVAKIYFYGAIPSGDNDKFIKKVTVDYYTDTNTHNASRELRYTVTPRSIRDYDNDQTTTIAENINTTITQFNVSDATSLVKNTYITIGTEEMYIQSIVGNTIKVLRGQDKTTAIIHEDGDAINVINSVDNELITPPDEFGFDEERFDFGDGRIYSPTKGVDV